MRMIRYAARVAAFVVSFAALASSAEATYYKTVYTTPAGTAFHPMIGLSMNKILYGVDKTGGTSGKGSIFSLSNTYQLSILHSFTGADGQTPNGRLANIGSVFYGTTLSGGANKTGTVFSYAPYKSTPFTLMHSFVAATEGVQPQDGVVVDPVTGLMVGTTSMWAISPGNGTVFSISTTGVVNVLWQFQSGADGHCPYTGVAIDSFGDIYGTTVGFNYGGNPKGSVWGIVPGGTLQTLYLFTDKADGEYPQVAPIVDTAGNLWGQSTEQKGQAFAGSIWEIPAGGTFKVVYSLNGPTDGFGPNAPLALGQDGNFYGTTASGGKYGYGTLFRLSPSGVFTVIHSYTGGADGGTPTGNLIVDSIGDIIGGTALGTVFVYQP